MKETKRAFPTLFYNESTGETNGHDEGMSLRDYFANSAMQGIVSENPTKTVDYIARRSFEIADAMLKQREL